MWPDISKPGVLETCPSYLGFCYSHTYLGFWQICISFDIIFFFYCIHFKIPQALTNSLSLAIVLVEYLISESVTLKITDYD